MTNMAINIARHQFLRQWRILSILLILTISFFFAVYYSFIAFSQFPLAGSDVWQVVFNYDAKQINQQIIVGLRLPRTLVTILVGVAMAIAGLLMQGITRNPLASPSVFGVSAGAAFAFASTGIIPWLSFIPVIFITMAGALIAGIMVFFLGGLHKKNVNPIRVILAGVALNYLCISMTRAAVIFADEHAYGVLHWLIGSVSNTRMDDVFTMLPGTLLGVAIAIILSHKLNMLHLGEEIMSSLGGNTQKIRIIASIAIIMLIASSVSVAGPIGFIGLMIPHIARFLVGQDYRILIPLCCLLGANLMLVADIFSRVIRFPDDSPLGIITSFIGAAFFLLLALKQVRKA